MNRCLYLLGYHIPHYRQYHEPKTHCQPNNYVINLTYKLNKSFYFVNQAEVVEITTT